MKKLSEVYKYFTKIIVYLPIKRIDRQRLKGLY